MAACNKVIGFLCEFIDPVSEDFLCKSCNHVARDPSLTSCCGETFCQACITQVLEDKKPCPDCETVEFTTMPSVKYQKRILALQVCCAMKDRGCGWTGKLEGLDAHLNIDTGDCQYIDVPCPDCDQQVQKRELTTHLGDACPKRDYNCRYCGFSGTYEVVCNDHWPECEQYPIPCPNYCGLAAIERCTLEDHLPLCSMQEVECDFTHAGCTEKFLRQDLERHMEENTQKHLVLMSAATLKISQEFEKKLQEQREEFQESLRQKDQEIGELKQQLQEAEAKIGGLQYKVEEKQHHINEIDSRVEKVTAYFNIPPFHFNMSGFDQMKTEDKAWYSPPMYTHLCGYRISIGVAANGLGSGSGTHVTVWLNTERGKFDHKIPWPAKCTITLELLNQYRDQDHIRVTKVFELTRTMGIQKIAPFSYTFIAHSDLGWNAEKQTQYLKQDCLQFKVTKVEVKKLTL